MEMEQFSIQVAVKINLLFNNLVLFGAEHPSLMKAATEVAELINSSDVSETVTLLKNGESFYINRVCVDSHLNTKRTIQQFTKCHIESLSFCRGVTAKQVAYFGKLYQTAVLEGQEANHLITLLEQAHISSMLINYVTLQEVRADQAVVEEGASQGIDDAELEKQFILGANSLFTQVNTVPNSASEPPLSSQEEDSAFSHIVEMSARKQQEEQAISGINTLKDEPLTPQEKQTLQTMAQLLRDEYRSGSNTPQQVAFLLKRLTSSATEVKRLVPFLKNELSQDDISPTFYASVLEHIESHTRGEQGAEELFKTAEEFGVDRDELAQAIAQNPEESLKLLVQSAELDSMTNSEHLSEYIANIIEAAGEKMVAQEVSPKDGPGSLDTVVSTIENRLLGQLKNDIHDTKLYSSVAEKMKKRYPETLRKMREEWLVSTISQTDSMSVEDLSEKLLMVLDKTQDVERYKKGIATYAQKWNMSVEEVEKALQKVGAQSKPSAMSQQPDLLSPRLTIFFIKRYIDEYQRYAHPFSIIAVSDHAEVVSAQQLVEELRDRLRTLDILGRIMVRNKEITLFILPMTDSRSLYTVYERIKSEALRGKTYIVSSISCDAEQVEQNIEYEMLMKQLLRDHLSSKET
ncbi:hypothetical protein [Chitinivibrio alkaliphilus]|uniref:Uncharacterized protein n=1 Tax=Chitinivibrio alkaliphilus ACht1 TaxID=1313304 RepID=U7DAB3_9BACT|nr:hypothetical protein [Chitinivibrio alkaliphilus]ERP39339.1 hypothetical protein CALK_0136 [Chitinivibrio alkaliphilus ACht1]